MRHTLHSAPTSRIAHPKPRPKAAPRRAPGVAAAPLLALLLTSCGSENPAAPTADEAAKLSPALAAAAWTFDVNWGSGRIDVSPPNSRSAAGGSFQLLADYFGLEPGHPELSILGQDVVELVYVPGTLTFAPPNASSMRRRVAVEVRVVNRLSGVALTGSSDLPVPPPGVRSPVLFAVENVTTVTHGGVTVNGNELVVEMPSHGEVVTSDSIWVGPPHDFFHASDCTRDEDRCYLYLPLVEEGTGRYTLGARASSAVVRLGWDVDLTVHQFRSRLILAADAVNPQGE